MLSAQPQQFSLNDHGQILYQAKPNNPVPGVPVAQLEKGETPLEPGLSLIGENIPADEDKDKVAERLQLWVKAHIASVLEPLVALRDDAALDDPVAQIGARVYQGLGIVPRADVAGEIGQLDADMRGVLRAKRIRLGPVLIFQPDLNKPAPVRLRALLWSLYHEKPLPVPTPKDGVVSFAIDKDNVDKDFYQVVGYPVYGSRAIRIDMLDRVINAVYEGADKGKFLAKHEMAEWLGSTIEGLYEVLEALGHTKIYDPAEEAEKAAAAQAEAEAQPEQAAISCHPEEAMPTKDLQGDGNTGSFADAQDDKRENQQEQAQQPQPQAKPELATFRLKKGRANEAAGSSGKPKFAGHAKKHDGAKRDSKKDKKGGKRNKSTNKTPRVMSAEAKVQEDSPFAVLQQLKR